MREIKFRGRRVDNGEWVEGDLLLNNGNPIIVKQVSRGYIGFTDVEVGKHWHIETPAYSIKLETVGQFTGFLDRNGKEIYEGDVLKDVFSGDVAEVHYQPGYFTCNGVMGVDELSQDLMQYEVIGNIHENPELL